ncbi:MAG: redoxin family protein [Deltaproteobacteria bacterium]|nr:redoxin family protein [Deltaproteobacteria bacterium]
MSRIGPALVAVWLAGCAAGAFGMERAVPGQPFGDFTLPDFGGNPVTLRQSLGARATVVVFWASWSPRSAEVLSDLQIFYRKHGRGDLAVVAVNVEHETWDPSDAARLRTYLDGEGVSYPVIVDTDLSVYSGLGLTAVPSSLLLDASGTVVEVLPSYPELQRVEFLERVLVALGHAAAPPAPSPPVVPGYTPKGKAATRFLTAKALLAKGRRAEALAALRDAIQEDPGYRDAYLALAEALDVSGRQEEAAEVLHQAESLPATQSKTPN